MEELYVYNLLKRFTENNLTEAEDKELQIILRSTESDEQIFKFMDDVWESLETSIPFTRARADYLYSKIVEDPRFLASVPAEAASERKSYFWLRIAASVLIAVGLSFGAYKAYFMHPASSAAAYSEYQAKAGQLLKMQLPDGTAVWLNSGSKIRISKNFGEAGREVYLDGEGFFDVTHDEKRAFKVHTHDITTQVLGTAFNVSAYGKEVVQVTVARGKVSVKDQSKQLALLKPDRQLTYNRLTKIAKEDDVRASLYTAWKEGDLVLNNLTMAEAAEVLSKTYGVKFSFSNPKVKNCRFVASFPRRTTITEVMNIISKLNGFSYQLQNKVIKISGKGCS